MNSISRSSTPSPAGEQLAADARAIDTGARDSGRAAGGEVKRLGLLDVIWNFAFVVAAAAVLVLSIHKSSEMPLRVWIVGYALQCVLASEWKNRKKKKGV